MPESGATFSIIEMKKKMEKYGEDPRLGTGGALKILT